MWTIFAIISLSFVLGESGLYKEWKAGQDLANQSWPDGEQKEGQQQGEGKEEEEEKDGTDSDCSLIWYVFMCTVSNYLNIQVLKGQFPSQESVSFYQFEVIIRVKGSVCSLSFWWDKKIIAFLEEK